MPDTILRPGDKVRCVNAWMTSLEQGKVYTVDHSTGVGVRVVEPPRGWYDVARFRKEVEHGEGQT